MRLPTLPHLHFPWGSATREGRESWRAGGGMWQLRETGHSAAKLGGPRLFDLVSFRIFGDDKRFSAILAAR